MWKKKNVVTETLPTFEINILASLVEIQFASVCYNSLFQFLKSKIASCDDKKGWLNKSFVPLSDIICQEVFNVDFLLLTWDSVQKCKHYVKYPFFLNATGYRAELSSMEQCLMHLYKLCPWARNWKEKVTLKCFFCEKYKYLNIWHVAVPGCFYKCFTLKVKLFYYVSVLRFYTDEIYFNYVQTRFIKCFFFHSCNINIQLLCKLYE